MGKKRAKKAAKRENSVARRQKRSKESRGVFGGHDDKGKTFSNRIHEHFERIGTRPKIPNTLGRPRLQIKGHELYRPYHGVEVF